MDDSVIIKNAATLPDSAVQGHPWLFDLKSTLEANKNNPSFKINNVIKKETEQDFARGATALVVINSSSTADNLQFERKDTTTSLDIPVVYVTSDGIKKHFINPNESYQQVSVHADVEVVD